MEKRMGDLGGANGDGGGGARAVDNDFNNFFEGVLSNDETDSWLDWLGGEEEGNEEVKIIRVVLHPW